MLSHNSKKLQVKALKGGRAVMKKRKWTRNEEETSTELDGDCGGALKMEDIVFKIKSQLIVII